MPKDLTKLSGRELLLDLSIATLNLDYHTLNRFRVNASPEHTHEQFEEAQNKYLASYSVVKAYEAEILRRMEK